MDMDMTVVHVSHPLWFSVSVTALIVFAFVGLPLVRRSSRPILTLLLAPVFSLAISDLGIAHVAAGMAISGRGVHSTAAGLADAEVVLVLGFAVAAIVSILAAVTRREQPSAGALARTTAAMASIFGVLLGAHSVLAQLLADQVSTFATKASILA